MKTNKEIIKRLTEVWYHIVSTDHHKDRDCHWHINTVYSYGEKPIYRIEHYGYIYEDILEECNSYEDAEERLIEIINNAMEKEKDWANNVLENKSDWDEYQVIRAETIINLIINK